MTGFVFLFCLLFRCGILHRVLLVVGWCWILYSSGFLCVSSHYLIPSGRWSLVGYSPRGCEESDTTEQLHFHFSLSCTGEGNGNTFQCSCLENPRDGGAWWTAVYGVTKSRTWLTRLSSSSSSVSSLVVRVLEAVLPPKGSGLDLYSGTKIPQVVCYGIKWD